MTYDGRPAGEAAQLERRASRDYQKLTANTPATFRLLPGRGPERAIVRRSGVRP